MKKNKLTYSSLFSLLFIGVFFTSCNTDDNTDDSTLVVSNNVSASIMTDFDSSATINVDEFDEDEFTYTVTLSEVQSVDVHVKVAQIAGDATADEDFEFDSEVIIPAYSTTGTGKISILNDDTVEGMESFTIEIGDRTANASVILKTVSFTINNYESTELDLKLTFGRDFYYQGEDDNLCDFGYDMDYLIYDALGNDVGNYTAVTGACPAENMSISVDPASPNYLPDGTYYVVYNIYDDGGLVSTYHDIFDIPTSVDYLRSGVITKGSFNQEEMFVPNSISGVGDENLVCIVEINSGVFTVKYGDDTVIASGRQAARRPSAAYRAHKSTNRSL